MVAHRPARSVTDKRGAATRGSSWVHEPCPHQFRGHQKRCLRHRKVTGRPKHVRSTSSTTGRSFTHARSPQFGHVGGSMTDSTVTTRRRSNDNGSLTSNTFTAGRPTNSSHARVAFNTAGAPPDSTTSDIAKFAGPLLRAWDPHTPLIREAPQSPAGECDEISGQGWGPRGPLR